MTELEGVLYRSGSSHAYAADVAISENGTFTIQAEGAVKSYTRAEYTIEPRLGATRRVVQFSDGVRLELESSASFNAFEDRLPSGKTFRLVDWLEARWPAALASIVGVLVFIFLFIEFGIPVVAESVAHRVPQSVRRSLSESSLDTIVSYGSMEESYSMKMNTAGNAAFDRALGLLDGSLNPDFEYELRLFKAPYIGPNAFALPSGLIIATEEFIELCENEEQMVAVFLHEIAHVEEQHGLRALIQDAGLVLILSLALGDVSSLGGFAASLPALALESRYSQNFEKEADLFAGRVLEESGIGAEAMTDILILLHEGVPDIDLVQFFSTHPGLEERVNALEALSDSESEE